MIYYRCKCGNAEAWSSMGVAPCIACSKCGSDLAASPNSHGAVQPHSFVTKYDTNTGAPYETCDRCYQRKDEIEAPDT